MAEQREATRRDPRERFEVACNAIGSTVIGNLDEVVERGGDDLLRRVRATMGHLATVERALKGASRGSATRPGEAA
jgi:hypothetical protein